MDKKLGDTLIQRKIVREESEIEAWYKANEFGGGYFDQKGLFTINSIENLGNGKVCFHARSNIDGKWYDANGSYIFGPNLSQNEGCKKADDRAKEDVLRLAAPEVVTGQKYLNCHSGYRTVDLVPEKEDNKICSKVYFDALVDNELIKVWGYDCNG